MADSFNEMRKKYGISDIGVYLNTPANGLMSARIEERLVSDIRPHLLKGSLGFSYFMETFFPKVKSAIADFIHSDADNIALMPNYSFAHLALLSGVPKETKVALLSDEYPSVCAPFEEGGYETKVYSINSSGIDYTAFREFLSCENIDILALSHVQYLSGFMIDLEVVSEMCRDLDICMMLDVTQSIGYETINVRSHDIDVVAGSCYKWLNAGYGTGFMSVSEKFRDRYKAQMGGFMSYRVDDDGSRHFVNSIANYEPGNLNPENYARLLYCLEEKEEIGTDQIREHNTKLLTYVLDSLADLNCCPDHFEATERGAFARIKGDDSVQQKLEQERIYTAVRGGFVRFGCHFYNNREDMDRFLEIYRSLAGN